SFRLLRTGENDTVLLRVLGPPYFSLLRAIDRTAADLPCAYIEHGSGVWIEYGWTHPLAGQLRPPAGQIILLRPPDRWRYIEAAAFHDIYDALILDRPPETVAWSEGPADALDVPLKLAAGNTVDAAELWVLGERGEEQIDALVHTAHSRVLGG